MNALFFDGCWIVGGTPGALVLYKVFHAGWWQITLKRQPPDHAWLTDRRNPLGAAADPLHFKPYSLSDKAAKGFSKNYQRHV